MKRQWKLIFSYKFTTVYPNYPNQDYTHNCSLSVINANQCPIKLSNYPKSVFIISHFSIYLYAYCMYIYMYYIYIIYTYTYIYIYIYIKENVNVSETNYLNKTKTIFWDHPKQSNRNKCIIRNITITKKKKKQIGKYYGTSLLLKLY